MRSAVHLSLALCLFLLPLAAQPCNLVVNSDTSDPADGSCNVIPFGQSATYSAGYTYVASVAASQLSAANPYIDDFSFAPCGTGNWSCSTVIVGIGHVPSPMPSGFTFPSFDAAGVQLSTGDFLDLTVVHNSFPGGTVAPLGTTSTGPLSWNYTTDTWSPMGFSANGGTGFFWNGTDDVAFFITFQNSVTTGHSGSFHRGTQPRTYGAGYLRPVASTNNSAAALNMQLQVALAPFSPGIPPWQCNQNSSNVSINGAADPGPLVPMTTTVGLNSGVNIDLDGLAGMPFEIAYTVPQLGVPVGGGGLLLPGNQALNIDLVAPSLSYLFGLGFTNAMAPTSLPLSSSVAVELAFQQAVVDPTQAVGLALSHLNELSFAACSGSENFDTLATGQGTAPLGWSNPGNVPGSTAWTVDDNGTSSSGTGPTGAFNGSNYLYCETSGNTNTTFTFDTCATDFSTLTSGTLSFELSAIGATIGTLNVYQGDGAGNFGTTPIFTQVGALTGQSQGGIEWTNQTITLLPLTQFLDFRFEYISGTSFTGDLAVDDIQVL